MSLPDSVAIMVSIVFMASTIIVSAALVLRIRPIPYCAKSQPSEINTASGSCDLLSEMP